ncbi:hypothetical protein J4416_05295 [Candidatus Pacearchaeota archaeon]|nr:hypothetical protein [Candidatus Pacearchaeota archaeon]
MEDRDYVRPDYSENLERIKVKGICSILYGAIASLNGPSIVISSSPNDDLICLRNAGSREPRPKDLERCAFIPKDKATQYSLALVRFAQYCENPFDEVVLQEVFSFPFCQTSEVIEAIIDVAKYEGPLPFYAKTMLVADPSNN